MAYIRSTWAMGVWSLAGRRLQVQIKETGKYPEAPQQFLFGITL